MECVMECATECGVSWSVSQSCLRAISELSQSVSELSQSYLRAVSELSQSCRRAVAECLRVVDSAIRPRKFNILTTYIDLHDGLGRHSKREVWPASIHQYVVDCPDIFI